MKEVYKAEIRKSDVSWFYYIVVLDKKGNVLSKSNMCHPDGFLEHRHYFDDGRFTWVDIIALNERSQLYVNFNRILEFIHSTTPRTMKNNE
jgi:hypothetical protein